MISGHFHWKLFTLGTKLHPGYHRLDSTPEKKETVKYSKYSHCWCNSQGHTRVSRANDAHFEAGAFELGRSESQRRCQHGGPQLKHAPASTNHLNHKSMPCLWSWELWLPSWHGKNYLARKPWRLLLQTGARTRTVITQSKEHSSGTAGKLKFYIKKWMPMSNYVYEPKNSLHCIVCLQNPRLPNPFPAILTVNANVTNTLV